MSYTVDGFEVAPVFERQTVLDLRHDVTEHIDRVAKALHMPFEKSEPDAPFTERLERIAKHEQSYAELLKTAVCTDAHRGPRISPIINRDEIVARAEDYCGVKLGHSIMRLRINVPALTKRRHGWHSDRIYPGDESCKVRLTCWLPLTDVGPKSGGLEVVKGRWSEPFTHTEGSKFEIPEEKLADFPKAQIDCPVGSALFLDRYTPHRALPNETQEARFALVMWFKQA